MTFITGNTKKVSEGYLEDLEKEMAWFEIDGYDVDFDVKYLDDRTSMEVDVYINGQLAGVAKHFDDFTYIIDRYFEEGADN